LKLLAFGVGVSGSGGSKTFSAKGLTADEFSRVDNSGNMRVTSIESSGSCRTLSAKVLTAGEFSHEDMSGSMCAMSVESAGGGDVV